MSTDFYAQFSRSFEEQPSPQPQGATRGGKGRGGNRKNQQPEPNAQSTVAGQPLLGLTIAGRGQHRGGSQPTQKNYPGQQQPMHPGYQSMPPSPALQQSALPGFCIGVANGPMKPQFVPAQSGVSSQETETSILQRINAAVPPPPSHHYCQQQQQQQVPISNVPVQFQSVMTSSSAHSVPPTFGEVESGTGVASTLLSTLANVKRTRDGKYAVGQFVHVPVTSDGKKEIATIVDINSDDDTVVIESERSGFAITVKENQLNRAFLIILDLNGVLVHRKKSKSKGLKRPHVDEFLEFLLKHFVVGVWSSCIPDNGKKIVESLLGTDQRKLKFQMYRDDCTPNPTPENHYGTRKDLLKVWARYPSSFNETNTVIIDDSADKCSHPMNAFVPSTFEGDIDAETDAELLRVIEVLQRVIDSDSLTPIRTPTPRPEVSAGGAVAGGNFETRDVKRSVAPAAVNPVDEEDDEDECVIYAPGGL